ncbi:MAG: tyrosine-protein phosphatase [Paludibacteraceae bacterium]|nr:tyrosine-protein phosphatase [Paludibacteraceae bacterium]
MKCLSVLRCRKNIAIGLALFAVLTLVSSCGDKTPHEVLNGKIVSYNEFGAAMLSFTEEDMTKAGFSLGDVVAIALKDTELVMPYYDGFYSATGEYICVGYPGYPSVCFTANNTGLPSIFMGREGEAVAVKMKEKGGRLDVQTALGMKYKYVRNEYPSDEAFANARSVRAGNIAEGRLHRSSSPFSNEISRAQYVADYLEQQGVVTVLNLTDNQAKMASYDMPAYSRQLWESGNVILCPLKADPTVDAFNTPLIAALIDMSSRPGPYVVHCTEGKDRTGYVCALLEGLCGATYQEMVDDYLKTYENYYFITPTDSPDVCRTLLALRLNPCLMYYAGIDNEALLPDVNFAEAFAAFMLEHGMTRQQLDSLIQTLTETGSRTDCFSSLSAHRTIQRKILGKTTDHGSRSATIPVITRISSRLPISSPF